MKQIWYNRYNRVKITKKFVDRIRKLIQPYDSWKVSLKEVADNIGIGLTSLKNIVYGYKNTFSVYTIDKVCVYYKLAFQELVGIGEIIDKYEGGIMGLEITDAVYNILDKNEGYWEEGKDFVYYKMDGLDLGIPKDLFEDWIDTFFANAMKKIDEMKERKEKD